MYAHPLFRYAKSGRRIGSRGSRKSELGTSFFSLQEAFFDTSTSTGILLFQVVGAIAGSSWACPTGSGIARHFSR